MIPERVRSGWIWKFVFLLLCLFFAGGTFADENKVEDFPWEIFYPAFIKKSIDRDRDGFSRERGDCDDSDPGIHPDATEICGDGVDQDCDGTDLPCPPCTDIAGDWNASETVTITCCIGGDCDTGEFSGSRIVTIQQNGCNISYDVYVSGYGTFTRTGTIDDNRIEVSGIFAVPRPGCSTTQNNIDVQGTVVGDRFNLQGSGIMTGECDGSRFSCTGSSTSTFIRSSASATGRGVDGNAPVKSAPLPATDTRPQILTILGL